MLKALPARMYDLKLMELAHLAKPSTLTPAPTRVNERVEMELPSVTLFTIDNWHILPKATNPITDVMLPHRNTLRTLSDEEISA
jgi:hypothetical protein